MRAAGWVLVGGSSLRMGRDKARLPVGSHLLVEEVAAAVASVAGNVCLLGPPERYGDLSLECLPDLRPAAGPLGGLESALASRRADLNLVAACDLPGVEESFLRLLLDALETSDVECAVARDAAGRVHPLCAAYRSCCLSKVRAALDTGRLRVLDLLAQLTVHYVDVPAVLANVNRPEDWVAWNQQRTPGETRPLSA